jgi:hypothetical protein
MSNELMMPGVISAMRPLGGGQMTRGPPCELYLGQSTSERQGSPGRCNLGGARHVTSMKLDLIIAASKVVVAVVSIDRRLVRPLGAPISLRGAASAPVSSAWPPPSQ